MYVQSVCATQTGLFDSRESCELCTFNFIEFRVGMWHMNFTRAPVMFNVCSTIRSMKFIFQKKKEHNFSKISVTFFLNVYLESLSYTILVHATPYYRLRISYVIVWKMCLDVFTKITVYAE